MEPTSDVFAQLSVRYLQIVRLLCYLVDDWMSGHFDALAPLSRNGALMSSASRRCFRIGHNGFDIRCFVVQLRELSLGELDGFYSSDSFTENDPASGFSC